MVTLCFYFSMDESNKNSLFQSVAFATTKELNDIDWSHIPVDCCDQIGNSLLHVSFSISYKICHFIKIAY